jgi:hypothetical protein
MAENTVQSLKALRQHSERSCRETYVGSENYFWRRAFCMLINPSVVKNKGNNNYYFVSTILNAKKTGYGLEETQFETIVALVIPDSKKVSKPQIVFHSLLGSHITLEELHEVIEDIVGNEDFEKIKTEDGIKSILYSKKQWVVNNLRSIFSIIGMYKCPHVFIWQR